jgi:hypothetical protein
MHNCKDTNTPFWIKAQWQEAQSWQTHVKLLENLKLTITTKASLTFLKAHIYAIYSSRTVILRRTMGTGLLIGSGVIMVYYMYTTTIFIIVVYHDDGRPNQWTEEAALEARMPKTCITGRLRRP